VDHDLTIKLESALQSPRRARRALRLFLGDRDVSETAREAVVLVVSELVTNAVVYGCQPIELYADVWADVVRVEVTDGGPHLGPVESSSYADPAAETGRGLAIVDAVVERWGVTKHPDDGKAVWAEISTDAQ
jgi:anti-sigma regulatory factor (Ser/Thr protein kinase)